MLNHVRFVIKCILHSILNIASGINTGLKYPLLLNHVRFVIKCILHSTLNIASGINTGLKYSFLLNHVRFVIEWVVDSVLNVASLVCRPEAVALRVPARVAGYPVPGAGEDGVE